MIMYEINGDSGSVLRALNEILKVDDKIVSIYEYIGHVKHLEGDFEGALAIIAEGLGVCRTRQDFQSMCALRKAIDIQIRVKTKLCENSLGIAMSNMLVGL